MLLIIVCLPLGLMELLIISPGSEETYRKSGVNGCSLGSKYACTASSS